MSPPPLSHQVALAPATSGGLWCPLTSCRSWDLCSCAGGHTPAPAVLTLLQWQYSGNIEDIIDDNQWAGGSTRRFSCKHQYGGNIPMLHHQPNIHDLYYGHQPQHSWIEAIDEMTPTHWSPALIGALASSPEATDDLHTSSGHPFLEPTLQQAAPIEVVPSTLMVFMPSPASQRQQMRCQQWGYLTSPHIIIFSTFPASYPWGSRCRWRGHISPHLLLILMKGTHLPACFRCN